MVTYPAISLHLERYRHIHQAGQIVALASLSCLMTLPSMGKDERQKTHCCKV